MVDNIDHASLFHKTKDKSKQSSSKLFNLHQNYSLFENISAINKTYSSTFRPKLFLFPNISL